MQGLNKVQIIGNLGSEPEMQFTRTGNPVTTFNVAVNRKYTQDGESREEATWFNIVAWNKTAENCNQYLVKGSQVYIEGRLHNRSWEGQDGQKHYRTEVIASNVIFLDRKPREEKQEESWEDSGTLSPEDLPF